MGLGGATKRLDMGRQEEKDMHGDSSSAGKRDGVRTKHHSHPQKKDEQGSGRKERDWEEKQILELHNTESLQIRAAQQNQAKNVHLSPARCSQQPARDIPQRSS